MCHTLASNAQEPESSRTGHRFGELTSSRGERHAQQAKATSQCQRHRKKGLPSHSYVLTSGFKKAA